MTRKNEQERFMSYITERQTHESRMAVADFLRKYADPVQTVWKTQSIIY